ncbi:DUF4097 family beta strand repeat-containing protein [Ligilactobacillus equi]|uniref:DUF4097 domain-containing protein n=1 Tax=Ligilactobacillus equi DSM 15833 = JCM 10991 TaxID=1423740 RepID=A0A0R1TNX8_9LACO|nr:DUF4097 family beta strand repeat-containing protein [Ligilactobacillus equi]KRL80227.1 hypothetical protein FC36_GL000063 [Ligilactobacillus equi DSM 15833 = JCM 10991]
MKKSVVAALGLLVIGTCLLVNGLVSGGNKPVEVTNYKVKVRENNQKSGQRILTQKEFQKLEINVDARIQIKQGNQYKIESYGFAKGDLTHQVDNGTLQINQNKKDLFSHWLVDINHGITSDYAHDIDDKQVTVTVPKNVKLDSLKIGYIGYSEKLSIQEISSRKVALRSGSVELDKVNFEQGKIRTTVGNLDIHNSNLNQVDLEVLDSDLDLYQTKLADSKINISDGDMLVKDCDLKNMDVKLNDGDATLSRVKVTAGHLTTSDGDVMADNLHVTGVYRIHSIDGDLTSRQTKADGYQARSIDGDVFLFGKPSSSKQVQNVQAANRLELVADSGDIHVN